MHPPFRLTRAIHYDRYRPAGVYHDLAPADQAALAKYGAPEPVDATDAKPYPAACLPVLEEGHLFEDGPEGFSVFLDTALPKEELHADTKHDRPDDSIVRPDDSPSGLVNPLACPHGCRDGKPFKSRTALAAHRLKARH
jgi:hypothetical protein